MREEDNRPRITTRHGQEPSVLLSVEERRSLAAHPPDLRAYLLGGPKFEEFEIKRDPDTGRTVDL